MRAFQIVNTYTHVYIYILVLVMEILDSSTIPRSRLSRSIEKTRIPQEMDRYKFSILLLRKLLLHDRYYYHHRVIDPIQFNPRLDQNLVENLERMIRSSLVIEHSTVNRKSSKRGCGLSKGVATNRLENIAWKTRRAVAA